MRYDSTGLAPEPHKTAEAVLQLYGADAYGWRGWFAIHTWFAAKRSGADHYTVYQVIGWRLNRGLSTLSIGEGIPDRYWFGSKPDLLSDHRGDGVDELIDKLDRAARAYPFTDQYTLWPGPNSNSFAAWIGLEIPELELELPRRAIGKNWMERNYRTVVQDRARSALGE